MARSREMQRESSACSSVIRMLKQEGGELALGAVDEEVAWTPKSKNTIERFMTPVIGPPALCGTSPLLPSLPLPLLRFVQTP